MTTTTLVHTTCQYKKFYSIVLRRGGETKKTAPIFETIYASHWESFSIFHNIILVKARRQYYLLLWEKHALKKYEWLWFFFILAVVFINHKSRPNLCSEISPTLAWSLLSFLLTSSSTSKGSRKKLGRRRWRVASSSKQCEHLKDSTNTHHYSLQFGRYKNKYFLLWIFI